MKGWQLFGKETPAPPYPALISLVAVAKTSMMLGGASEARRSLPRRRRGFKSQLQHKKKMWVRKLSEHAHIPKATTFIQIINKSVYKTDFKD